jgi:hypothetical protein
MSTRLMNPAVAPRSHHHHNEPEGRYSPPSVRSFIAYDDEAGYDDVAVIPDIPLRSSSRQESVAEYIASSPGFRTVRRTKFADETDHMRGPINPNTIQPKSPMR